MNTQPESNTSYKSLSEIRLKKQLLQEEIKKDDLLIRNLWNDIFHKKDIVSSTPSKRINALLSVGAGVIDSLILGWKLYNKFSNSPLFRDRSRRR